MKKAITIALFTAIILETAACAGAETKSPNETSGKGDQTSQIQSETADPNADSLPDNLDFGNAVIKVLFPESHGGAADQIDWVEEDDGDIVNSALFARRTKVEERLKVKFEVDYYYKVNQWAEALKNSVLADDKSWDVVWGDQADTIPLSVEGIYLDLANADYLDYSKKWWNNDFMDEISIGKKRDLLAGDISLSMLSYMSCMYFHKDRFENISGESADDLYKLVLDGGWTMDKLAEYCRKSYSDLNGSSSADEADAYGMGAVTASTTDHMTFDSGIRFTTRDKNGMPELNVVTERSVDFAKKLYSLFYENEGVRVYPAVQQSLRIDIPNKLMNGEMTFMCGYFYSATLLRDMKADYGIIPYPKLDETIEGYRALVHDSAQLVSIPITCDKVDAVCAAIEAIAAENYRTVTPAYYETALKTKYIRDDMSGEIVDMIHSSGTTDFAYAYNTSINRAGLIMRTLMEKKTSDIASTYAGLEAAAKKGLADLIENSK